MKEWSPLTWTVVCCVQAVWSFWLGDDWWLLMAAAGCAWAMAGITALERQLPR